MKCSIYIGTSLDGFIAREDGNIDWLMDYSSDELFRPFEEFMKEVDVILMGRNTFEKVMGFDTWYYKKKVFVLSKTLREIPENFRGKAELIPYSPSEALNFLSGKGYSKVYVDGGQVIQSFLREDLIDEMIITRLPILIGSGIPLFGRLPNDLTFTHVKTDIYPKGLVMNLYMRVGR